jgi:hypothetical protein
MADEEELVRKVTKRSERPEEEQSVCYGSDNTLQRSKGKRLRTRRTGVDVVTVGLTHRIQSWSRLCFLPRLTRTYQDELQSQYEIQGNQLTRGHTRHRCEARP